MATLVIIAHDPVQALFLDQFPRFRAHALFAFRHVRCPDTRDDRIAETIALVWRQFVTLVGRGKHPECFVTTLALRCTQAVKAGRRLAGGESLLDVFSTVAAARYRFALTRNLDSVHATGELADALTENDRTPVPDQAAFRVDFPRWRASFRRRDRAILDALMAGGGTDEVARTFRVTAGRVSQLRRTFEASWQAFHSTPEPA